MTKKSTTYDMMDALTAAIAVDRVRGFIKSGSGYYDFELKVEIPDNKTAVRLLMSGKSQNGVDITEQDRDEAMKLKDYFDSLLVMKKVTGSINGFEDQVGKVLAGSTVDDYGISILASLPNSLRIQRQRDSVDEFYDNMRHVSEYVGTLGQRARFQLFIKDIKYIAKYSIHLVTAVESERNLVKFFWSRDPDVSDLLVGNTMYVTGTVKEQSVSKFSSCKETVINRVKIERKI